MTDQPASTPSLRRRLYEHLDPEAWHGSGMSPLNWVLMALIVLSIVLGILATEPSIEQVTLEELAFAERIILIVFLIELVARLWICGLNPRFNGPDGFFRYLIKPATVADIIVVLPLFLSAPPHWIMIFRLFRILRLLRLSSFPHIHQALKEFGEAMASKRFELTFTVIIALMLVLVSSTALYLAERSIQPEVFGSIPRAMWWSIVTFTTVGYGDAVPVTAVGRVCAGVFAVSGIGVVAMLTGVIASALSDAAELHQQNKGSEPGPDA